MLMAEGPPDLRAIAYEVMHPARIEMIEKETAKLLNPPDIPPRCSSCL